MRIMLVYIPTEVDDSDVETSLDFFVVFNVNTSSSAD